ncbi:hypothetical protein CASFOL_041742 [Castilleja foliolosa]|uniref:Hyaluronan/mRNA-binding protein domain-containing protein n=1 Tax=Castilleja foliolosa TaxID=1961234 RepID=A0ABD3B906_9LAMI
MATLNPFDLLGDNDSDDPSLLIASQLQKIEPPKKTLGSSAKSAAAAKAPSSQNKAAAQSRFPSKPVPPTEAVRDAKNDSARGGRGGRGYGLPRGAGGGSNRNSNNGISYRNMGVTAGHIDPAHYESKFQKSFERPPDGYGPPPGSFGAARQGALSNEELGEHENNRGRRYERHSGTGRGNGMKREGGGRGNWGRHTDDLPQEFDETVNEDEKTLDVEKPSGEEVAVEDGDKETAANEVEEKPEDKEMTLEEYEKLLEEKRKALLALKTEERKVDTKEFESMQPLSNKKANDEIFIKLSSEKDKKKELAEKEERAKKSLSINEFLKPAEGEKYYSPGGRGRGRGRGGRGAYNGGSERNNVVAPAIEDPGQFPSLGGK